MVVGERRERVSGRLVSLPKTCNENQSILPNQYTNHMTGGYCSGRHNGLVVPMIIFTGRRVNRTSHDRRSPHHTDSDGQGI